jgi:hypothetical protein
MTTLVEIPFFAPVPKGHEVLVVTFELDGKSPMLVHDKSASTVFYYGDDLAGPLNRMPELAVTDPVAAITRFPWTVKSALAGLCTGALCTTHYTSARGPESTTRLFIEPASAQPYR